MKKKAISSKSKTPGKLTARDFGALIAEVRGLIQSARHAAATTVNTLQVLTNFEIGRRIVEHEQQGAARAEYGKELLKELSARLTEEFGKGFSTTNLKLMRQFFIENRGAVWGQVLHCHISTAFFCYSLQQRQILEIARLQDLTRYHTTSRSSQYGDSMLRQ